MPFTKKQRAQRANSLKANAAVQANSGAAVEGDSGDADHPELVGLDAAELSIAQTGLLGPESGIEDGENEPETLGDNED